MTQRFLFGSTSLAVLVTTLAAVGKTASAQASRADSSRAVASRTALTRGVLAIVDVNLITMLTSAVQPHATVIVRDGRIAEVGESTRVRVPAGATRIDGQGKFLMPGLADMHTHLYSDDEVPDSLGKYEVGVLLANGITSARLMIGTPAQLQLRKDIEAGRVIGPQLWSASPQLTGRNDVNARVVTTVESARAAVREVAASGYDFVKITNFISDPAVYDAIMSEARAVGIRVDGHIDPLVGVPHALEQKENLQHLDAFFEAILADSAPTRASVTQYDVFKLENWKSLDYLDDRKIGWIAGLVAHSGVWITPTLTLFNHAFAIGQSDEEIRARPEWPLMPATVRDTYLKAQERYWSPSGRAVRTDERRKRYVDVRNRIVKAIADSGGKLLAGSDAPEWFFGYGWTLHRELESLVTAGLTPYAALRAATVDAATFLNSASEWGTIATGKRADLLLLSDNPLSDIRNTTKIAGVMIGGRWLEMPALDAMVKAAIQRVGAGASR